MCDAAHNFAETYIRAHQSNMHRDAMSSVIADRIAVKYIYFVSMHFAVALHGTSRPDDTSTCIAPIELISEHWLDWLDGRGGYAMVILSRHTFFVVVATFLTGAFCRRM